MKKNLKRNKMKDTDYANAEFMTFILANYEIYCAYAIASYEYHHEDKSDSLIYKAHELFNLYHYNVEIRNWEEAKEYMCDLYLHCKTVLLPQLPLELYSIVLQYDPCDPTPINSVNWS